MDLEEFPATRTMCMQTPCHRPRQRNGPNGSHSGCKLARVLLIQWNKASRRQDFSACSLALSRKAMNLTTIDLGNAGVAGKDPTTFSAPSAGEPAGNASSGFGQWMAQALERIDVNGNSLQTLEVSAGAQPLQTGKDGDQIMTPGHDAVLLPPWMQAWPTGLAVEQVGTGADLQVITARSPDPDTASLMAFAQAQGMDPHAIALLLGQEPGTPANTAASASAGISILACSSICSPSSVTAGVWRRRARRSRSTWP